MSKVLLSSCLQNGTKLASRLCLVLKPGGAEQKLPRYHRRKGPEILVKDLFDLAVLCGKFKQGLRRTGFSSKQAEKAEKMAETLENVSPGRSNRHACKYVLFNLLFNF
jgi:hypothetical protein